MLGEVTRTLSKFVPVVMLIVAWLAIGALDGAGATASTRTVRGSGTIGADGFLSPDHKTWCSGNVKEVGCVSFRGPVGDGAAHGAVLKRGGKVVLCPESSAGVGWACFQNFDETAPVLSYGQSAGVAGFRCTSTRQGITCIARGSGRGFRIDRTEATAIH